MNKTSKNIIFILLFFLSTSLMFAQAAIKNVSNKEQNNAAESNLDEQFLNASASVSDTENKKVWEIFGFVESENYFGATGIKKRASNDIIKLENRLRLSFRYGDDFFYTKASADFYYYAERNNLNPPQNNASIEAQEIYVGGGEKLQYKVGKQLFNWGVADAFKVSNFLDQSDLRELFAKDIDDRYRAVPGLDLKYLFGDFAIETALLPLHTATLLPAKGSYWELIPAKVNFSKQLGPFSYKQRVQPEIQEQKELAAKFKNISTAFRVGGSISNLDFHLSYFNGIDNNLIFIPSSTFHYPDGPLDINLTPYYGKVESGGLDLAFNFEKFTFRGEGAYTPQKWALKKNATSLNTEHFLTYSVGADYNVWGADGRIFIEWMQGKYLVNPAEYEDIFLTDILMIRLEDKYLNGRLETKLSILIRRPQDKDRAFMPNYELTWNFQNGFSLTQGAMFFLGDNDALVSLYKDHDYVFAKAKMTF